MWTSVMIRVTRMNVIKTLNALTHMAPIDACVMMVFMGMGEIVPTLTSASSNNTTVNAWPSVSMCPALSNVHVMMAGSVSALAHIVARIWMSAQQGDTRAVLNQTV